jgi:peptidoglycan/LPS O-acetylase OafA/YrhL
VFFHHLQEPGFSQPLATLRSSGWIGVELFFVIVLAYRLFDLAGVPMAPESSVIQWAIFSITCLVATTLIAVASYFVLERPILRKKERFPVVLSRPP